jgi:hypothetical protein
MIAYMILVKEQPRMMEVVLRKVAYCDEQSMSHPWRKKLKDEEIQRLRTQLKQNNSGQDGDGEEGSSDSDGSSPRFLCGRVWICREEVHVDYRHIFQAKGSGWRQPVPVDGSAARE